MGGSVVSSSLWLALPTATVAAVLVYLLLPDERQRAIRGLPSPASTLPVFGNTLDIMRLELPRLHDWIAEQCKVFGGRTWRLEVLGAPPLVVVSSVECFEDVLKTQFEVFDKGERMNTIFRDVIGGGITAVDGNQWRTQRKILSRLMTTRAFRESAFQCVHDYTLILGRFLSASAKNGVPIDFADLMHRFSFDVFTNIAFGLQANSVEGKNHTQCIEAIGTITRNIEVRLSSPDWLWKCKRALKLGSEKELAENVAILDKTVFTLINKNIERNVQATPGCAPQDVVSLFLNAQADETSHVDAQLLRDIAVVVLLAGMDTTAWSLSWLIVMLNRNPRVELQLRHELRQKLPRLFSDTDYVPSMVETEGLVYLEAVLRENMRLNPVVPLNAKEANRDTTLVDGTFLKKGTRVYIPSYTLGRMKSVWGRDASRFKPERWLMQDTLTGELTLRPVSAFQFVSFHAGPRTCLGFRFAMLEMKIVAAYMLSKYHFITKENPKSYTYDMASLLRIKGPLIVKVQRVS